MFKLRWKALFQDLTAPFGLDGRDPDCFNGETLQALS